MIEDLGIDFDEYRQRFHELTNETLAYLGRKIIIKNSGLEGRYPNVVDLSKPLTDSDVSHILAYLMIDELSDKGTNLPAEDLFRAPDNEEFWSIALEAMGEPFQFHFKFPQHVRYDRLEPAVQQLLVDARADRVIQIEYSHVDGE